MEGFYVFTPCFPWGLLVLLRIAEGEVLADVIRFVPDDDNKLEEVMVPLFRVSLTDGNAAEVVHASWLDGRAAHISWLDPLELRSHLSISAHFQLNQRRELAPLLQVKRALRLQAERLPELEEPGPAQSIDDRWFPSQLYRTADEVTVATEAMLSCMLNNPSPQAAQCDLALIRGPADFTPQNPSFPGIRPGLYVGDYGHSMYGQYRTEVLLLEYTTMSPAQLQQEAENPSVIFARPGRAANPPAGLLELAALGEDVTFMRGVKQCGDLHVPMGATTFVAICGPDSAIGVLERDSRAAPPDTVTNRENGVQERAQRSWNGWGTLAMPGFGHPSWSSGWLVQFQDDAHTGDHRFGFAWDRNQDAIVLRWIPSQDTCPFLQRAWLPEDLQ